MILSRAPIQTVDISESYYLYIFRPVGLAVEFFMSTPIHVPTCFL